MRRILLCIVTVLLCMPLAAQEDPVVMTVNGYDVSKSEFKYFFDKNNIETTVTKKTVRQYADMYLNFKLKVQAAIDEGMDKSESFLSEYGMCRDMVAEDYLLDKEFLDKLAHETYEQSVMTVGETGLAYLFLMSSAPKENTPEALNECYERMKSVYEKLQQGEPFQELARKYSEDELAAAGGEVGWVSAGQFPEEFAEQIFNLDEGNFSEPFISDDVVFIVMVTQRRLLGTFEQNAGDLIEWMQRTGAFDEARRRRANEYASRLGWTIRDDEAVAHLDSVLEEVEPEFGNLVREYHDGLLVFDISNHEIWERASNNPEEMENYFQTHRKQFKFDKPAFRGVVLFCKTEGDFNSIKEVLDKTDMNDWIDSILAYNEKEIKIRVVRSSIETGLFRQGQNEYVDNVVFGIGEAKSMSGYPYANYVGTLVKEPDSIEDVSGEVAEEYQKYLEKEWLKRLKSKYKYKINKKVLKTVSLD